MSSDIRINAKNAMRLGLESYDVTDIGAKSLNTTFIYTPYRLFMTLVVTLLMLKMVYIILVE